MKHILRSFFSFFLIFSFCIVQAQEISTNKEQNKQVITQKQILETKQIDSILPNGTLPLVKTESITPNAIVIPEKTERYGVRIGADLYKLTRGLYDANYKGIELVTDYRLTKKYFLAAEIGTENKTTQEDRLHFTTKGSYIKVGFDYNGYQNWLNMENIISIGLRYGLSSFNQELNTYTIYNATHYWGDTPVLTSGKKFNGLAASCIEVVAGVKAKVFNNVFLGFSLRLNRTITNKEPDGFSNLYIPGFNRTYEGSFGVGFNYTVTYFVPIYKKKIKTVSKM